MSNDTHSGLCSAHRDGEDPQCRICYPRDTLPMKRYRCYYVTDLNDDYDAFSEESDDGDWCRAEDVNTLLQRVLPFFMHKDGCQMREWCDEADHKTTFFGFVITGDECTCGAIALAREIQGIAERRIAEIVAHPQHLNKNAPYKQCSNCGRLSWDQSTVRTECGMEYPSGKYCAGQMLPYDAPL